MTDLIKKGNYKVKLYNIITKTSYNNSNMYIVMSFIIEDGIYRGRKLFHKIFPYSINNIALKIAFKTIESLSMAKIVAEPNNKYFKDKFDICYKKYLDYYNTMLKDKYIFEFIDNLKNDLLNSVFNVDITINKKLENIIDFNKTYKTAIKYKTTTYQ